VPSRARYVTVAFCVVLALITYVDRVAISQAAPFITQDLGLTRIEMGWALAIFGYAYAIFEIPGGWLADRIGPRKVLMRIVTWWSIFTAPRAGPPARCRSSSFEGCSARARPGPFRA
jgi:ACS family glucarate transporter-like MFS transporter